MTDRRRTAVRAASSSALALAALGALAACSGAADGATGSSGGGSTASADPAVAEASGTWTETGEYQTPGGRESVEVTLTAEDGTVTKVAVKGSGGTPNSERYQGQFISGVSEAVVGKPLATLEVGAVSGSSLTGQGFNAAVDKIRADAA